MADRVPVGWLQFFFKDYLPESPCPPGCRHRHSIFKNNHRGSESSGSPHSSDVGEDIFTSNLYAAAEDPAYTKFAPIPILLDQPTRKISSPYSEGDRSLCHSPVGYPDDEYCTELTTSDEELKELKELDDLISIYSGRLSESESDRKSVCSIDKNYRDSPTFQKKLAMREKHRQCSVSDSEIGCYADFRHRPSQIADCVLSDCHCVTKGRQLSINDVLFKSPLAHAHKLYRDAETQCVYSDIVYLGEFPSPRVVRRTSLTDDGTLKKRRNTHHTSDNSNDDESDYIDWAHDADYDSYIDTSSSSSRDEVRFSDNYLRLDQHMSPDYDGSPTKLLPPGTKLHLELKLSSGTASSSSSPLLTASSGGYLTAVSASPVKSFRDSLHLSSFPAFVIDFFQFAAHPEDYLTDEQLEWYYEGEAKLMKRREERKRARNALIEETTRLEAANHTADASGTDKRSISTASRELPNKVINIQDVRAILPEVESVDIPTDLLENPTVIRLAQQLKNSENLRKEVLVSSAKLENERSTLIYQVEDLKDQLEDQTELAAELKISLKAKCRDIEKMKMQVSQKTKDVEILTCQVEQREVLLKEKAGIIITQLGDILEVPLDNDVDMENGALDKYSIKKIEDIEKDNCLLKEEITALREELSQRSRNHVSNHVDNSTVDPDLLNIKRELEKAVEVYKTRLTVEERDKIKLQGQISVLESQVKRYRGQVQLSSEAEDEALREKRRLQKELRIKSEELNNSQEDYATLLKKLEKAHRPTGNR